MARDDEKTRGSEGGRGGGKETHVHITNEAVKLVYATTLMMLKNFVQKCRGFLHHSAAVFHSWPNVHPTKTISKPTRIQSGYV